MNQQTNEMITFAISQVTEADNFQSLFLPLGNLTSFKDTSMENTPSNKTQARLQKVRICIFR